MNDSFYQDSRIGFLAQPAPPRPQPLPPAPAEAWRALQEGRWDFKAFDDWAHAVRDFGQHANP